jgi:hypothetical protein
VIGPIGIFYLEKQQKLKRETSNWNTYINQNYGFSFKYPSGWQVNESQDTWDLWEQVIGIRQYPGVVLGQIHVFKQIINGEQQNINDSVRLLSKLGKISESVLNGKKVYRIESLDKTSNTSTIYVLFEENQRIIQMSFAVPDVAKEANIKLVNQIVNTLQLK